MTTSQSPGPATTSTTPPSIPMAVEPFPLWAVIAYGAITALLGIALLVWPQITLFVTVAFFAVQLIITGMIQLVRCVSPWASGAGERTLLAVVGALSLLAALLILRRPLQTLLVVTVLIGAWWIVRGIMDIIGSFPGGVPHRGWKILLGALSLVAGIFVLLNPEISLVTFVWIAGLWMIASGIITVVVAVLLRRDSHRDAARAAA